MSYQVKHDYGTLIGRTGNTFSFLDYTFQHTDGMRGAVGTRMSPVSEKYYEDRKAEFYDPEFSPLKSIFDDKNFSDITFTEFVDAQFRQMGRELILDFSHYNTYGERVKEITDAWEVECIGGGRMFNEYTSVHDFDEVYNEDLMQVIRSYESDIKQADGLSPVTF